MEKIEPIKCCWSGCNEWGDEFHGWWGNFIFCSKHNKELLKDYENYLSEHSEEILGIDDIFGGKND